MNSQKTTGALFIGQVAEQVGMGIPTIRFYERQGLIENPPRTASGYRRYPADAVSRLRFIVRAKELGFSLREIKELLNLRVDPTTTCADVRIRARAKITDVEEKIRALEQMNKALKKLAAACRGKGPASECPILDELDRGRNTDA